MLRAIAEAVLIGVAGGALGCWVVLAGLSYATESLSHSMLPGGLLGTSLATKLCERRAGLKVLLTTGFSETAIMHRGLLDGSMALLSKPYKVEELARRVRSILDEAEETKRVPA